MDRGNAAPVFAQAPFGIYAPICPLAYTASTANVSRTATLLRAFGVTQPPGEGGGGAGVLVVPRHGLWATVRREMVLAPGFFPGLYIYFRVQTCVSVHMPGLSVEERGRNGELRWPGLP